MMHARSLRSSSGWPSITAEHSSSKSGAAEAPCARAACAHVSCSGNAFSTTIAFQRTSTLCSSAARSCSYDARALRRTAAELVHVEPIGELVGRGVRHRGERRPLVAARGGGVVAEDFAGEHALLAHGIRELVLVETLPHGFAVGPHAREHAGVPGVFVTGTGEPGDAFFRGVNVEKLGEHARELVTYPRRRGASQRRRWRGAACEDEREK